MSEADDDMVSAETLTAVARARARAAAGPTADEISRLLESVSRRRSDLTPDDIRELGAVAIRQSQRVSFLLGRLSVLLNESGGDE